MQPTFHEMFRVFGRIGVLSFGGPAAQVALMHQELVENREWLDEQEYLRALSFCMLLPGPEAMQLATYAGWKQRGIAGGLIGGGLFVIPGAFVIMALALTYAALGTLPLVQALFLGVQATVVIIVIGALRKLAKRSLSGAVAWTIAVAGFIGLFIFALPFPLVIAIAGGCGAVLMQPKIDITSPVPVTWSGTLRVLWLGGLIWAAPVMLAVGLGAPFLTDVGIYFSQLAVVTFGGAYAVLAYMAQAVVADFGWLSATQMMDALGLAETTPGPLILVTQFVAMLAGLAEGGVMMALLAGTMALWVTFVPCFIWIFAGAPLVDWLAGQARLQGALAGITAAVVGVMANLSLWFAFHVFFETVLAGPFNTTLPVLHTLNLQATVLALGAGILMFWRGWGLLITLVVIAIASLAIGLF